jgi:hypothetical protein
MRVNEKQMYAYANRRSPDGKVLDRMSAFLHAHFLYRSLCWVSEEFQLYLMISMLMIRRFDFFENMLDKIDDEQEGIEILSSLPVSKNFLGNVWRIGALF